MTAREIIALLAARHPADKAVFVDECKMGQQGSRRLDAWALLKTWAPLTIIGYEVKVSRQDFIGDQKWAAYLPVCHELYFACPPKLIAPEELPEGVGLLWAAGSRLVTKRKAPRRAVDHEKLVTLMSYVLMSRARVVADMWEAGGRETSADYWRRFVRERREDAEVGQIASRRITEQLRRAAKDRDAARRETERYQHIEEALRKLGLDPATVSEWNLERKLFGNTAHARQALREARALVQILEAAEEEAEGARRGGKVPA